MRKQIGSWLALGCLLAVSAGCGTFPKVPPRTATVAGVTAMLEDLPYGERGKLVRVRNDSPDELRVISARLYHTTNVHLEPVVVDWGPVTLQPNETVAARIEIPEGKHYNGVDVHWEKVFRTTIVHEGRPGAPRPRLLGPPAPEPVPEPRLETPE